MTRTIVLAVLALAVLAAAPAPAAEASRAVEEARLATAPWSPRALEHQGPVLTVVLRRVRIEQDTYARLILRGFCHLVTLQEIDLPGVEEIRVLNRFRDRGYRFAGGARECRRLGHLPRHEARPALRQLTRVYLEPPGLPSAR